MKRIFIPVLLLGAISFLFALPERQVARIDNPSPAVAERFLKTDMDIAAYIPGRYLDLVADNEALNALRAEFPHIRVTQTEQQLKDNLRGNRDIAGYHTYAQMVAELDSLQALYPGLMATSIIGSGWGASYAAENLPAYLDFDHDIWAVKLSANVSQTEDEPAFYFVGDHHAREPLSTEVCLGIMNYLLQNYGTDPVVTQIMNTSEVWVIPLINPDGHKIVVSQTDVWWRKNIRDNNDNQAFDHENMGSGLDGVDLNRNYGYYWGYASATDNILAATYHGPGPFSEPEVQAFRDFLLSKRFLAGIGYHTYGELVLFPYGFVSNIQAPDHAELQALANEIAGLLPSLYEGNYTPGPSWGLYPASGSLDDWAYGVTGAFAYTIEMAQQFIPTAAQVAQIVPLQVNAALHLLQRKDIRILRGHVTDAETGAPVAARIYIEGFDDLPIPRAPITADSLFGSYYYMLPAGSYNVLYLCPGYDVETRTVTISADSPTIQDVSLTPTQPYTLSIAILGDFDSPIPDATLKIDSAPDTLYVSDQTGYITLANFYPGEYGFQVSKPGFETLNIRRHVSTPDISLRISSQPGFEDGFEVSMANWTTTGNWNRTTSDHYFGSYSLTDSPSGNYQNNSNTTCKLNTPINLSGVENANLQFWVKAELSQDEDCLVLEYSPNGSSWYMLDFITRNVLWTQHSYSLNTFLGESLYFRFRLSTSNSGTANGVCIDGFKIFTSANVTPADDPCLPRPETSLWASPNPITGTGKIELKTTAGIGAASLDICNLRGQLITRISIDGLTKGTHAFAWDGRDSRGDLVASGIYFVNLRGQAGTIATAKIALIK